MRTLAAASIGIIALIAITLASTHAHAASSGASASSSPQPLFSTAAASAAVASGRNAQLLSRLRSHTLATPAPHGNHATLGVHAADGYFPPSYSFRINALDKEFEIRLKKNSAIIDKNGYQHIK